MLVIAEELRASWSVSSAGTYDIGSWADVWSVSVSGVTPMSSSCSSSSTAFTGTPTDTAR